MSNEDMVGFPISQKRISHIAKLTKEGMNRPSIAREVQVSKFTVYKYQKKLGLL